MPPTENAEEIDTSTRPRLTQEQVTVLEEEFSKLPKPNTDFKKELANRIGLTLARVNVSGFVFREMLYGLRYVIELVPEPPC